MDCAWWSALTTNMKRLFKIKSVHVSALATLMLIVLSSGSAHAAATPGCYSKTKNSGVLYVSIGCTDNVQSSPTFDPTACYIIEGNIFAVVNCGNNLLKVDVNVNNPSSAGNCAPNSNWILGFPTWYKYLTPTFNSTSQRCEVVFQIAKPITRGNGSKGFDTPSTGDIGKVFLAIVEILLRISGMVAVGFIVFGGFQFLISQGDPQKAVGARHTILNALIGLVIAAIAVFVVQLLAKNILQ